METLKGKIIYVIGTGARKIIQLPKAIREFTEAGASVYTIMSDMGREICDSNLTDFEITGNTIVTGYSREGERLPLEDLVLVAPCTFNTLNKISAGIADTYATTIIASSIGKKRKVVIALAMNSVMWEHPQTQESIKRIQSWGCKVVYPEISLERVTMVPIEKIADTVFSNLAKIRYESERVEIDDEYTNLIEKNYAEFRRIGELMIDLDLTRGSAGCLSKKIDEWYLVSSSGSHVGSISLEELTLVKKVQGQNKKIVWKGYREPSSETPLLIEIYSSMPRVNAILHGHCPRITYDDRMQKYATQEYVRYGVFGESDKVINIAIGNNGFCILKLHGEVCIGESLDDAFFKLKSKLEEAHR